MISHCPACDHRDATPIFETEAPVLTLLPPGKKVDADRHFHSMRIVACNGCGHMYNAAFLDELAETMYGDVPLTNVPVHPSMTARLHELIEWLGPDAVLDRRVLEIGAGAGHLARLLAQKASNVTVVEPCVNLTRELLPETNITLVTGTFPPPECMLTADLVICRQVLEHVPDPFGMIQAIRSTLREGGLTYLEVPSAEYIVANAAFADIHPQHVQYFHTDTLMSLAARADLTALRVLSIKNGHDFGILFQAGGAVSSTHQQLAWPRLSLARVRDRLTRRRDDAAAALFHLSGQVALYGASPQAQILFNIAATRPIDVVLDDNHLNHGLSMFSRSQSVEVNPPTADVLRNVDAVVIGVYLHDIAIAQRLRELGFYGEIYSSRPAPIPTPAPYRMLPLMAQVE